MVKKETVDLRDGWRDCGLHERRLRGEMEASEKEWLLKAWCW